MPSVPTYDSPQVETRALPGTRQSSVASPALFSAGADQQVAMGRGLMQAGEQLNAVAVKMQERENADKLFQTETALKDDYLKFEQGIRERKGQSAWGATTEAEQWFAEQEKKHSEALGNDVQRHLFKQQVTKLRQSAMGSISQYESGERRRSLEESAQASIVSSINQAAASAAEGFVSSGAAPGSATITKDENGNPVATAPGVTVGGGNPIAGIKSDILRRVQTIAQINGWGDDRRRVEEATHLTNLHKQVIKAIVGKDPDLAREYFETNKAEIAGTDHADVSTFIDTAGGLTKAQTVVDTLRTQGVSTADAMAYIEKNLKGDAEKAAKSEWTYRLQTDNLAENEAEKKALGPINRVLGDARLNGRRVGIASLRAQLTELSASSPDLYAKAADLISNHNRETDARAKAAAGGVGSSGSATLNATLLEWDMKNNPAKYKGVDMTPVLVDLARKKQIAPGAVDRLLETHAKLGKAPDFRSLLSVGDYLNQRLTGATIAGTKFSAMDKAKQDETKARAVQVLEPLLAAYQENKGDKADDKEVRAIVDSIFTSKRYRDTFLGVGVGAAYDEAILDETAAPGRVTQLFNTSQVDKLNPGVRKRIEDSLRARGYPVTPENIIDNYNALQGR